MAFMSQERKAGIQAELKSVIPSSWKWSLAVRHHSTIVLTIRSAPVDLVERLTRGRCLDSDWRPTILCEHHYTMNPYHWREAIDDGDNLVVVFGRIFDALFRGNHDNSDSQIDYFDVGWYVDVEIGRWNKPFEVTGQVARAA